MNWYVWKIWRFAWASSRRKGTVVEGNNRWTRLVFRLFFRYDNSKGGTRN